MEEDACAWLKGSPFCVWLRVSRIGRRNKSLQDHSGLQQDSCSRCKFPITQQLHRKLLVITAEGKEGLAKRDWASPLPPGRSTCSWVKQVTGTHLDLKKRRPFLLPGYQMQELWESVRPHMSDESRVKEFTPHLYGFNIRNKESKASTHTERERVPWKRKQPVWLQSLLQCWTPEVNGLKTTEM